MKALFTAALGLLALTCCAGRSAAQNPPAQNVLQVGCQPNCSSGDCYSSAPACGCCDPCNSCGPRWHATGEVGVYILKPHWTSNPAFYVQNTMTNNNQWAIEDFDYDFTGAPQISIGAVNDCGFGFRISWWQLDADQRIDTAFPSATAQFPTPLAVGTESLSNPGQLIANSSLRMVVWDFEAVQSFRRGQWDLKASGGIRYAHLSQDFQGAAGIDSVIAPGEDVPTVISGHNFNGAGPTVSMEGARRMGSGNVLLYASGRASVLFGDGRQTAGFASVGSFPSAGSFESATNEYHTILPVGELEVGARWQRCMGRGRVFFQAGLVGQAWVGAGNTTRAAVYISDEGSPSAGNSGPIVHDMGLIGINLKAGVDY